MNYRRILYIAFIVFIALFLFRNFENDNTINKQILSISKEFILDSIMADSELNQESNTIYFPLDFKGKAGEVFYVSAEKSDGPVSYKYRIEEIEAEEANKLEFVLEQTWEGIKMPANKFDAYRLEDGRWVKI